jgi:hypothetical protein
MKNLLCIIAITIASNSFAQDTTKAVLRGKTITMISHNQRFTENPQLQEVQSKCDFVQMTKSCNIAQLWEMQELSNEYNSLVFKALYRKGIKEVHKIASETYAICRKSYDTYKECLQKKGLK